MSKKMKVWTAGVLGIMMAGLVCVNVMHWMTKM